MASQIPNTFYTKFNSNMRMALQQQESVLWAVTDEEQGEGEKYLLQNIVGQVQGHERTNRNEDNKYIEATHDRVWVTMPNVYDLPFLLDRKDNLETIISLQGAYVMASAQAIQRWKDNVWIRNFYGNMLMGKDGTTYVPFAASNVVPVNIGATGPTGMNIDKLKRARRILKANFANPSQEWYIALTAAQIEDLQGQVEATDAAFQKTLMPKWSDDGKSMIGMLGFIFLEIELSNPLLQDNALTLDVNGYRKIPFWTRDGMKRVPWEDLFTSIDRVPGKGVATQVYTSTTVTATRTDNGRCGYILCLES